MILKHISEIKFLKEIIDGIWSRHGGAIYQAACSNPATCTFAGISETSGATAVTFEKNTAGEALLVSCIHSDNFN
jgi:hypothetical protein